jgi:hypothetical protein
VVEIDQSTGKYCMLSMKLRKKLFLLLKNTTVKHAYKNMGNKNNRDIFLSLEVI